MQDEMKAEYDLSKLKGRVRGKYAGRYREAIRLIKETDAQTRTFTPEHPCHSAFDLEGIDLGVSTEEIVELSREESDDCNSIANGPSNCPAVGDGDSM